jgi:hypothetical protein
MDQPYRRHGLPPGSALALTNSQNMSRGILPSFRSVLMSIHKAGPLPHMRKVKQRLRLVPPLLPHLAENCRMFSLTESDTTVYDGQPKLRTLSLCADVASVCLADRSSFSQLPLSSLASFPVQTQRSESMPASRVLFSCDEYTQHELQQKRQLCGAKTQSQTMSPHPPTSRATQKTSHAHIGMPSKATALFHNSLAFDKESPRTVTKPLEYKHQDHQQSHQLATLLRQKSYHRLSPLSQQQYFDPRPQSIVPDYRQSITAKHGVALPLSQPPAAARLPTTHQNQIKHDVV